MTQDKPQSVISVLQASLQELWDILARKELEPSLHLYARALKAFLLHDLTELSTCLIESANLPKEDSIIRELISARFDLRSRTLGEDTLERLLNETHECTAWNGEIRFVAAMGYEWLALHEKAKALYAEASVFFKDGGAPRKAVKALLNHLVCESRLFPDKKLMADYHYIYKEAKKVGDPASAGVALLNISREYQKIGAYEVALKYCNRALAIHDKEFGSITHFLTLAHRSQLLFLMGRKFEAFLDYDQCKNCDFAQVQAALKVIDHLIAPEKTPAIPDEDARALTPTWRERVLAGAREMENSSLGYLEQKLVEFLSKEPKEKFEIIKYLYGGSLSIESGEARFKTLLHRLRKKRPDLIIHHEGKYQISDEVFLVGKKHAG